MTSKKLDILHSDKDTQALLRRLKELPDTVTGYVVMADGRFGGEYTFPKNKDKIEVHWPPGVVEKAPPQNVQDGFGCFWTGSDWEVRPLPAQFFPIRSEKERQSSPLVQWKHVLPEYIRDLKRLGMFREFVEMYHAEGLISSKDEKYLSELTSQGIAEREEAEKQLRKIPK